MEELILRFVGYNLVSNVTGQIAGDIEGMVAGAERGAARINRAFAGFAASTGAMAKGFGAAGLALTGMVAWSAKAASDLEFQLNLLQTHAGFGTASNDQLQAFIANQARMGQPVSAANAALAYQNQQVNELRQGLIDLGPKVGFTATELAEAGYFASSAGAQFRDSAGMLNALTVAAQTAQMTHSDLATTMKTIAGVAQTLPEAFNNPARAAAELNAVVGQGVMTFDQFNSSLRTGFLGVAGTTNQSLSEMGGILDVLTTHMFGASNATTAIRYTMTSLFNQSKQHQDAFKALGLDQATFVNQMVNDPMGMVHGLEILRQKLSQLSGGLGGAASRNIVGQLFGQSRGSAGAMAILSYLDQINGHIADINAQADTFGSKWAQTAKQPAVMWQMFTSAVYSARTALGEAFIPMITSALAAVTPMVVGLGHWIQAHQALIETYAPLVLKVVAGAAAFMVTSSAVLGFISAFSPARVLLLAVAGALTVIVKHWGEWGPKITALAHQLSLDLHPALKAVENFISGPLVRALELIGTFVMGFVIPEIRRLIGWLGSLGSTFKSTFGDALSNGHQRLIDFVTWITGPGKTAFDNITSTIGRFVDKLVSDLGPVISSIAGSFRGTLLPALGLLAESLYSLMSPFSAFVEMMIKDVLPQTAGFASLLGSVLVDAITLAVQALKIILPVLQWLQDHFGLITLVLDAMLFRFAVMRTVVPAAFAVGKVVEFFGWLSKIELSMSGINLAMDAMGGKSVMSAFSRGAGRTAGTTAVAATDMEVVAGAAASSGSGTIRSAVGGAASAASSYAVDAAAFAAAQGRKARAAAVAGADIVAVSSRSALASAGSWIAEAGRFLVLQGSKAIVYAAGSAAVVADAAAKAVLVGGAWAAEAVEFAALQAGKAAAAAVAASKAVVEWSIACAEAHAPWVLEADRWIALQLSKAIVWTAGLVARVAETIAAVATIVATWVAEAARFIVLQASKAIVYTAGTAAMVAETVARVATIVALWAMEAARFAAFQLLKIAAFGAFILIAAGWVVAKVAIMMAMWVAEAARFIALQAEKLAVWASTHVEMLADALRMGAAYALMWASQAAAWVAGNAARLAVWVATNAAILADAITTGIGVMIAMGPIYAVAAAVAAVALLIIANWSRVGGFFSALGSAIGGFFSGAGSWLYSAGASIITGLWNGMVSIWNHVTSWFHDLPGNIVKWFRGVFGISSPSRVMHELIGVPIAEGVMTGVVAGTNQFGPGAVAHMRQFFLAAGGNAPALAFAGVPAAVSAAPSAAGGGVADNGDVCQLLRDIRDALRSDATSPGAATQSGPPVLPATPAGVEGAMQAMIAHVGRNRRRGIRGEYPSWG